MRLDQREKHYFIPSVTINLLDRMGKLTYDCYSYPWEAEANELGDANPPKSKREDLPEGEYASCRELIRLFFD